MTLKEAQKISVDVIGEFRGSHDADGIKCELHEGSRRLNFTVTKGKLTSGFIIGDLDAEHSDEEGMKTLIRREYADAMKNLK